MVNATMENGALDRIPVHVGLVGPLSGGWPNSKHIFCPLAVKICYL